MWAEVDVCGCGPLVCVMQACKSHCFHEYVYMWRCVYVSMSRHWHVCTCVCECLHSYYEEGRVFNYVSLTSLRPTRSTQLSHTCFLTLAHSLSLCSSMGITRSTLTPPLTPFQIRLRISSARSLPLPSFPMPMFNFTLYTGTYPCWRLALCFIGDARFLFNLSAVHSQSSLSSSLFPTSMLITLLSAAESLTFSTIFYTKI